MRRLIWLLVFAVASAIAMTALRAADGPPAWAYAIPPAPPAPPAPAPGGAPAAPAAAPDPTMKQIPGSTLSFTRQQIADGFGPADWFPGDHPAMPEIVAHGQASRRPRVRPLPLSERQGTPGERRRLRPAGVVLHPADERLPQRPPQERRAAEGQHQRDDRDRQGD